MLPRDDPSLRWDPSINPTSSKWTSQLSIFKYLLSPTSEETLDTILTEYFTPSERELALPATSPPWLVEEQAQYTARYRRLLAGHFAGIEDDSATRLTMLYFGLPAEPIMSGMFRAVDADVEMLDGADARIYEVRPPLHFLTAYNHRHYGRYELRGTEAPLSYIPISQAHATGLKLGRSIEEPEEAPRSSLRGGGEPDDDDNDDLMEDTEVPEFNDPPENIMLGFQGSVPFDPSPAAINGAIRALLSLVPHEKDRRIVLSHLDMGRLRNGEDPVIAEFVDRVPLRQGAIDAVSAHIHTAPDYVDCCAWFVRFQDEDEPEAWVPSPWQRKQMSMFGLEGKSADLRAYLVLPDSVGPTFLQKCGKNAYSAHMRTAMQVLLGRMNGPGENHVAVSVYDNEPGEATPLNEQVWCYGGLDVPRQVYKRLYRSAGRATPWTIQRSALDMNSVALVLEGYEQVPRGEDQLRRNFEMVTPTQLPPNKKSRHGSIFRNAWEVLEGMLDAYLSDEMKKVPIGVSVLSTYDSFEDGPEGAPDEENMHVGSFFEYNHSKPDDPSWTKDFAKYLEDEFVLKGHRGFHITLTCSKTYSLVPAWALPANATPQDHDSVAFPLMTTEISGFHQTIDSLAEQHPHPRFGDDLGGRVVYVTLEAVPMSPFCTPPARIVVTAETHQDELSLAFSQLMTSRFLVSLSDDEGEDFFAKVKGAAMPWGPRYGDVATFTAPMEKILVQMPSMSSQGALQTNVNTPRESFLSASPAPAASNQQSGPTKPPCFSNGDINGPPAAWVKQPSIFDGFPNPTIPNTGPPREAMLRTGGPGIPYTTMKIMTPTEQQRAIDALITARNQNLGRVISCHYKGCCFFTSADDVQGMREHLEEKHVAVKCPWCDSKLFAHMSKRDRDKHIAEAHPDELRSLIGGSSIPGGGTKKGASGAGEKSAPWNGQKKKKLEEEVRRRMQVYHPQPRAPAIPEAPYWANGKESIYKYCDRCGREHDLFGEEERTWHDRRCVPRAPHDGDLSYCKDCGTKKWRTRELSRQQEGDHVPWPHSCDGGDDDPHKPFCSRCAYPMGDLVKDEGDSHAEHCKGFSGRVAQFCPYCRAALGYIRDHRIREKHIVACSQTGNKDKGSATAKDTPYSLYPRCIWEEQSARPEEDLFYTGWRQALNPRTWTPGELPGESFPSARVADSGETAKPGAVAVRRPSEAAQPPKRGYTATQALGTGRGKKRPATSGRQSGSKRQKATQPSASSTSQTQPVPVPSKVTAAPSDILPAPSQPVPVVSQPGTTPGTRRSQRKLHPAQQPPVAAPALLKKALSKPARQSKKPVAQAQASADLGDGDDPDFKPEPGMFCSRCFRKVPKKSQRPRAKDPSFDKQMSAHMDPSLSCRIRRRVGEIGKDPITLGIGLPSRSGWIREDDLPAGTSLLKLREAFKEEYKRYAPTAYQATGTQSVWKHDPNNEEENPDSVKLGRELLIPPVTTWKMRLRKSTAEEEEVDDEADESEQDGRDGDNGSDDDHDPAPGAEGGSNAPGGIEGPENGNDREASGGELHYGNPAKSEKKKQKPSPKSKATNDGAYRDQREAHSEDEEPHPDQVRADNPEGAPSPKKSRKKPAKAGAGGNTQKQKLTFKPGSLEALERAAEAEAEERARRPVRKRAAEAKAEDDGDGDGQPGAKRQKMA